MQNISFEIFGLWRNFFDTRVLSYILTNVHVFSKRNNAYKTHKKLVSNPFVYIISKLHQFIILLLRNAVIEDSYANLAGINY